MLTTLFYMDSSLTPIGIFDDGAADAVVMVSKKWKGCPPDAIFSIIVNYMYGYKLYDDKGINYPFIKTILNYTFLMHRT